MIRDKVQLVVYQDEQKRIRFKIAGLSEEKTFKPNRVIEIIEVSLTEPEDRQDFGIPGLARRFKTICELNAMSGGAFAEIIELFCEAAYAAHHERRSRRKSA